MNVTPQSCARSRIAPLRAPPRKLLRINTSIFREISRVESALPRLLDFIYPSFQLLTRGGRGVPPSQSQPPSCARILNFRHRTFALEALAQLAEKEERAEPSSKLRFSNHLFLNRLQGTMPLRPSPSNIASAGLGIAEASPPKLLCNLLKTKARRTLRRCFDAASSFHSLHYKKRCLTPRTFIDLGGAQRAFSQPP